MFTEGELLNTTSGIGRFPKGRDYTRLCAKEKTNKDATLLRAAFIIDSEMCDVQHRRHRLVSSILDNFPDSQVFPAIEDYLAVIRNVKDRQTDFDFVLLFAKFMHIHQHKNLFRGINLPIFMVEHDAWLNFSESNPFYRRWSEFLSKNRVDAIAVSGLSVCERLQDEGYPCWYLPKAAPAAFLEYRNSYSGCICMFGNTQSLPGMYEARKDMFGSIRQIGLLDRLGFKLGVHFIRVRQMLPVPSRAPRIHTLRFEFRKMPEMLSLYSAAIICDIGMREPMAKHFEVSALGVIPIRDDETERELRQLGYKDGESMLVYKSAEDLTDKLIHLSQNRDEVVEMQNATRKVARANTWEVRARRFCECIADSLQRKVNIASR